MITLRIVKTFCIISKCILFIWDKLDKDVAGIVNAGSGFVVDAKVIFFNARDIPWLSR